MPLAPNSAPPACPVKLRSKGSKTNLFHWGFLRLSKRSEDPDIGPEAKRRFIRLWRIPALGVEDAEARCPACPAVPREIHVNEERSSFHWGSSGRWYWGGISNYSTGTYPID